MIQHSIYCHPDNYMGTLFFSLACRSFKKPWIVDEYYHRYSGAPVGVGMPDLVNRAIRFAKETHQRIDQRRKYSNQPYSVHLEQVATIVASVTDDQEMIASAWLHDVVEDTPATLDDIQHVNSAFRSHNWSGS